MMIYHTMYAALANPRNDQPSQAYRGGSYVVRYFNICQDVQCVVNVHVCSTVQYCSISICALV